MSLLDAGLLGILQGLTELFPFSSLGLLVIFPRLVRLPIPTSGTSYLPFLVALHVGTAAALILYFLPEWHRIIRGWLATLRGQRNAAGRLGWLLIIGTIPAGLVGILFKHDLARLFGKPLIAAIFLLVNGAIMLLGDYIARAPRTKRFGRLLWSDALTVGIMQILALIPGLSRSGATITGGIFTGLDFEDAAHFSFLLATPIILAAGLAELPKLHHGVHGLLAPALVGGILAGITAWFAVRYLMRYFEVHRLTPFALISFALGLIGMIFLI